MLQQIKANTPLQQFSCVFAAVNPQWYNDSSRTMKHLFNDTAPHRAQHN
jgi:hypothetical protein